MQIRTHIGLSLDGFMATPDGLPVWNAMPTFVPGTSHGYAEFLAECEAIVIGRTTFDSGHQYWTEQSAWPWEGYRVYVLTSRALPANVHADVIASQGGPAGLLQQLRAEHLARDVQLLGGPRVIQAFLRLGAVDQLGMVILPVMLGDGVPLFTPGAAPHASWRLDSHRAFPDGAVELVFSPAGDAQ
jgi:dihydrofolate reductase